MLPKYRQNDQVSINNQGRYTILEIAVHGTLLCDCCPKARRYFMYRLSGNLWVNEDQLIQIIIN